MPSVINTHTERVKIVLLLRDPRAIYASRKNLSWCKGSPLCSDINVLCSEMLNDYTEYLRVKMSHPHSIYLVQYEKLSLNIYNESSALFRFLRLPWTSDVIDSFITSHVPRNESISNPYSTRRNLTVTPHTWINRLSAQEIYQIESTKSCRKVIDLLGYKMMQHLVSQVNHWKWQVCAHIKCIWDTKVLETRVWNYSGNRERK